MNRSALIALLCFSAVAGAGAATTFTPTGVLDMIPTGMSDDTQIIVGSGIFGAPNLYYTEAKGVSVIGEGCSSGIPAISGDGRTVLGCHVDRNGSENAAKWLGGTSWQDLGSEAGAVPCGTLLSGAYGVNRDGTLGVGLLWRAQICKANAGTWDLVNGGPATVLPTLFSGPATRANAVNADGSVIVGWQDQETGQRTGAKWVNGAIELILTDSGGVNGEAMAVSPDGATIVGYGYDASGPDFGRQAWIWQQGRGMRPIGDSAHGFEKGFFTALDVSDNGKVVVGFLRKGQFNQRAFIWRNGQTSYLDTLLKNRGAVIPPGWTLNVASIISGDGKTIYGWGLNPDSMIEMFKVQLD